MQSLGCFNGHKGELQCFISYSANCKEIERAVEGSDPWRQSFKVPGGGDGQLEGAWLAAPSAAPRLGKVSRRAAGLSDPALSTSLNSHKSNPEEPREKLTFCKLEKEVPQVGKMAPCKDAWRLLPGTPLCSPGLFAQSFST